MQSNETNEAMPAGAKRSNSESTFIELCGKVSPVSCAMLPPIQPFQSKLLAKMGGLSFANWDGEICVVAAIFRSTAPLQPARLVAKLI